MTDLEVATERVTLDLLLENKSAQRLAFPSDYGVRIFIYSPEANEWQEIENGVTYLPEDQSRILESIEHIPFNQTVLGAWPRTDADLANSFMRVMVTGVVLGEDGPTGERRVAVAEFRWPER